MRHQRDSETGMDYMGARYYAPRYGRFGAPDPPFVDQRPGNPQSWNLYHYVRNNPLNLVDPTGNAPESMMPWTPTIENGEAMNGMSSQRFQMRISVTQTEMAFAEFDAYRQLLARKEQPQQTTQQTQAQQSAQQAQQSGPQSRVNLLTVEEIGNIIFNETRSLSDSGQENVSIDEARQNVAHAIINADVQYGSRRGQIARTAPTTVSPQAQQTEAAAYQSSQQAALRAHREWKQGNDPTQGATHLNMRATPSRAPFQPGTRRPVGSLTTQSGPYNNSYPTRTLGPRGIYVNTYKAFP